MCFVCCCIVEGITITGGTSDNNRIIRNIIISTSIEYISDSGTNTYFELNYLLPIYPFLSVEMVEESFTETDFIFTFNISGYAGLNLADVIIQAWWNGDDGSNNITYQGNSIYNLTLTPIFVAPGEDPILLNMSISAKGYTIKIYNKDLTVDPDVVTGGKDEDGAGAGIVVGAGDDDDDDKEEIDGAVIIIILISVISAVAGTVIIITIILKVKGIEFIKKSRK